MSDFDWTERFPDLRPIRSAPAMMRVNGIGFAVYGSRDHDAETGTYVKTYCFSFAFLPILALTAYRVADAPNGGWYFLGRVPLSRFAWGWNVIVLLAAVSIVGLIGWNNHTQSPEYRSAQKLVEADELAAEGQLVRAAQLYRDIASAGGDRSTEAAQRLRGLLDDPHLHTSLRDAAGVFQIARDMHQTIHLRPDDLEERGMQLIDQHAEADERGALALLNVLAPIATAPEKLARRRQSLLERMVTREPEDRDMIAALALHYEQTNQLDRCEELLGPRKDHLGDGEEARILGHILAGKDQVDDAFVLLERYTDRHLPELESARQTMQAALEGLVRQVNNHTAPNFPYDRARLADREGRLALFREYRETRLKEDPNLRRLQETFEQARRVVPAAIDLGSVLLRRAQGQRNPAARQADLKKAEKIFLSIQKDEQAASAKELRVPLGRVYYWLGKPGEGRKIFEEVLAAEKRGFEVLMLIGHALRDVGARGEACSLLEEAYGKEKEANKKFAAAMSRSLLASDLDERIIWLERANPEDADVKASLCEGRAARAVRAGKLAEAESQLRQAIDLYAHMPENAAVLNNNALAHHALYRVTGDSRLLATATAMLVRAVRMVPHDSIVLGNTVDTLLDAAVRDVIRDAIDLKALKQSGDNSLLPFLYSDQAGKRRLMDQLVTHPAAVQATSYLERLLILSPRDPGVYRRLRTLYEEKRSPAKLRELAAALEKGSPDLSGEERLARDHFAGKRDELVRQEAAGQQERYARVVKETEPSRRGLTYAVAAAELASLKMRLDVVGPSADADEIVALAESAQAAAPSDGTRRSLEAALLFRASRNLARKDPTYAALVSRTRRSLECKDMIAVALMSEGKTRQAALADADVQRVVELVRQSRRQFPDDPSKWAWIVLRAVDADEAAQLAQVIHADPLESVAQAIDVQLSPFSAGTALRACWSRQVAGTDQESRTILKQYADRGVPLPALP